MSIIYDKNAQTFTLNTQHSTYQIKLDPYGFLLHTYYGATVAGDMSSQLVFADHGFSGNPYDAGEDRTYSMDTLPQEYPFIGSGDFRSPALSVKDEGGASGCDLRYDSHRIAKGKYGIAGLPAVYAGDGEAESLQLLLTDKRLGLELTLSYGVFEAHDVITRAVSIKNNGSKEIVIQKALSMSLDFLSGSYELLHFYGSHGNERTLERTPIGHCAISIGSRRGTSSHQHNPFVILAERNTTEDFGSCYGAALLYSGSFTCEAQRDQFHSTRLGLGLLGERFDYTLMPGEQINSPEALLAYSESGFTTLSHRLHNIIRHNICRGRYKLAERPVLVNSWEAAYLDFNGEKLVEIAGEAAKLGIDMLVMDDGWFGERDTDAKALGDWVVNEKKLGAPLCDIVKKINSLGVRFGLWIEPEMVNEDSDLYRAHPDWAFTLPGKKPVRARNQLVLDFSRPEVVENIFGQISLVIDSANIEYIKMDMNRSITDIYSQASGCHSEGSILYRYMLGVYDFLERLQLKYPNILIEGCSGGGGRFDAGMLYYTPQIWCSDNTDAIERIRIQYGTSFAYPISAVGSHVSASPNHQTGRITDITTRAVVAKAGTFGYELDLTKLSDSDKALVRQQVVDYKKHRRLINDGLYYRLTDCEHDREKAAWMFVAPDGSEALLNVVTLGAHCNPAPVYISLKGLAPKSKYKIEGDDRLYSGSALMNGLIPVPCMGGEYKAWQAHLIRL